jgi:hypothetical protein
MPQPDRGAVHPRRRACVDGADADRSHLWQYFIQVSIRHSIKVAEPAHAALVLADMDHSRTYDEPSKVGAEKGEVIVDGPDDVAVSLTPDAAIETSERLLDGALTARGQQLAGERRARRHCPDPTR